MQKPQLKVPEGFSAFTDEVVREAVTVEGFLSEREMRFLCLLGAVPTAAGEVLEIGSFKGRSTIILAKASALAGDGHVNAVDPMTAPSITDPDLRGSASSYEDFRANIEKHGVSDHVRHHRELSWELATKWNKPIRLLWVDGDHTYDGTRKDLEVFTPHLSDGAIVAFHDVLHEFEGGARVFAENVLLSRNFGAAGFCGSIAWSQYRADPEKTVKYRVEKLALYRKVARLIPFLAFDRQLGGIDKKIYKLYRSRVPRRLPRPEDWISGLDCVNDA
jgi:predicted O-methyltransferase YrrM